VTVGGRRLTCVVGTRPQLIKAAAAWPDLRARHRPVLIDTGQHYDDGMAGAFFGELGLPAPAHQLGVGSGTHARQVAAERREVPAQFVVIDHEQRRSVFGGELLESGLGQHGVGSQGRGRLSRRR